MQKVCEREKSLLKDQAGNLGTRLSFLYHIVVTKVLAIEVLSVMQFVYFVDTLNP